MLLSLLILYLSELLFALPNQFTTEYIVGTGIHGLPLLSTVQLTVRQQSQNLFGFTFVVNNPSKLLIAFVDGFPCYESCFYAKRNGENVSLAYEPNVYDFAVFQQANQQTLFFFEGCRVDVTYCQITQIKGGTFCACQNKNNCADAQQMKLCFTPIALVTSTTALIPTPTLMKTTQLSTTLSSTSIPSAKTTQSTSTISSTPATSVTTTIASTTEAFTTTTSTITTTGSSTVSPTPSDCTTTASSSSSISTTQSSTTLQPRSTSSMQTSSISTTIQVSTREEITVKVGTTTIEISTSSSRIPTTSKQTLQTTESPTDALKNISDSGVSLQNVTQSLNATLTYTEDPKDLSPDDIYYVANILTEAANLTDLPEEDALLILQNIDNVLNANENVISESGSQQKFLDVPLLMVNNCNSSTIAFLDGENLGFASTDNEENSFNGLVDKLISFELLTGDSKKQNAKLNSISIPANVANDQKDVQKVFFTIYRNKKFFNPSKRYRGYSASTTNTNDDLPSVCDRQDQLPAAAPVMAATFVNGNGDSVSTINGQNTMATLRFNVTSLLRPLHGSYQVTWWDSDKEDWASTDRCISKLKDGMVLSDCPHLTDFTLIVDSKIDDPNVCDPILTDITLATNTLSIVSLLFLIIIQISTYIPLLAATIVFRKLLGTAGRNPDSIQLLFNIVLFFFYFFFTIFSNRKYCGDACSFMAALTYSLLLCSILLTIFQAQKTVIMLFPDPIRRFNKIILRPLSAFTLCFLAPFILSLILVFFTNFFDRNDGFCWVRPDYVIFATIIPVSVLILNAILCTILVIWRMVHAKSKFTKNGKHHDSQIKAKIISILVLQITMGMPWVVQYFTLYTPYTTAWHYVFSIIIGSQGTMLTLIYFYKRRKIYRRSTEERKRRAETAVIPDIDKEEDLQNIYQSYYLANPTI